MRALIDALPTAVYVISLRSGEILYVNSAGKQRGVPTEKSDKPMCYKIFCGNGDICGDCRAIELIGGRENLQKLSDEELVRRFEKEPFFAGRVIMWEGTPAVVEMRTEQDTDGCLNGRERSRLSSLVGRCVCMLGVMQDPKTAAEMILKHIADFYKADMAAMYEIDAVWKQIFMQYCWSRPGFCELTESSRKSVADISARIERRQTREAFLMTEEDMRRQLPEDELARLRSLHVRLLLVVPAFRQGRVCGFILVMNPTASVHNIELMPFLAEQVYREIRDREILAHIHKPDEHTVMIQFLGDFRIRSHWGSISGTEIHSEQVAKLLAYLLLNGSKDVSVQKLSNILWAGKDSGNPYAALRNLVYRARAALKEVFPEEDLLTAKNGSYGIRSTFTVVTDTSMLEEACRRYFSAPDDERGTAFREVMQLYNGPLLPTLSTEDWVLPLSGYYNTLFLSVVQDGAGWLMQRKSYAEVFRVCSRGLEVDCLNENLHCLLMASLFRQGNRGLALNYYAETARMFARDYGITPGPYMQRLRAEIAGEIGTA